MQSGIYKITFPNGKGYVGQSQVDVDWEMRRQMNHPNKNCRGLYYAVAKAKRLGHHDQILTEVISRCPAETCNEAERQFIDIHGTLAPHGYNLTTGGKNGGRPSKETRRKLSKAHAGRKKSEEHRRRIGDAHRAEKHYNYGKKPWNYGISHTEETKQKISAAIRGTKHTEETKRKMSESRRGKNNNFYGKKHSAESLRKMSETLRGKKRAALSTANRRLF